MRRWYIGLSLGLVLMGVSACSQQAAWPSHQQATLAAMNIVDPDSICTVDHTATMASSFFVLLGAGLLTGFSHCIGMCGPLVGAFAMRRRVARQELSTPLVLFQTGRLTTYGLLGLAAGLTGSVLVSFVHNWQGAFSAGLGLLVLLLGLGLLGLFPLQRWVASLAPAQQISRWLKYWMASDHPAAPFGLGLANGLLPCGPVYAMALLAATSGDPLRGASLMLIFGLGTLPSMLGLGFSASLVSLQFRSYLYRVAAVLVIVVGLQLTLRGLALYGQIPHSTIGSVMLW
ncbi:MAG: sulfite exporter TauE/SafE family protein [Anaerolineae bacterium]|nr:sulfite exporter TauE/SafE family protein [Anaerolineae bacterium]MCB0180223.1 sulfite exporter TauE/SafE family protein [Anaerolineae bacterium]MCB0223464.1 sulfite exporter TauE/SafE family protein [Anaerolineae bacterium]MCB9106268.1 sulfite exporter TauE/SafE family protein [Anaerolineales bacterium]